MNPISLDTLIPMLPDDAQAVNNPVLGITIYAQSIDSAIEILRDLESRSLSEGLTIRHPVKPPGDAETMWEIFYSTHWDVTLD